MSVNAPVKSDIPTEPMRLTISRQVLERNSTSEEGEMAGGLRAMN
jgi:hypothetical protein